METKINIAEILKDNPIGIKLYSSTFGYIKFKGVHKDKLSRVLKSWQILRRML